MVFYTPKNKISKFDKEALPKLKGRLLKLEKLHETMKKINSIFSSNISINEKKSAFEKLQYDDLLLLMKRYNIDLQSDSDFLERPFKFNHIHNTYERMSTLRNRITLLSSQNVSLSQDHILFSNNLISVVISPGKNKIFIKFVSPAPIVVKKILRKNGFQWSAYYKAFILEASKENQEIIKTKDFLNNILSLLSN